MQLSRRGWGCIVPLHVIKSTVAAVSQCDEQREEPNHWAVQDWAHKQHTTHPNSHHYFCFLNREVGRGLTFCKEGCANILGSQAHGTNNRFLIKNVPCILIIVSPFPQLFPDSLICLPTQLSNSLCMSLCLCFCLCFSLSHKRKIKTTKNGNQNRINKERKLIRQKNTKTKQNKITWSLNLCCQLLESTSWSLSTKSALNKMLICPGTLHWWKQIFPFTAGINCK